ncbi:hypothetical protein [Paenibacillus sp. O199]|uniref:hypothetical protein n=1 Tax=Paenibacillus sp. O199 TaxID=1643925 RepID=UPI0007BF3C2F|nr:hypothetical protein [Paenibacillus sp. O199]
MDIKLIAQEQQQDLYHVTFTEEEVDALYRYIDFDKYGIDISEGGNLLQKDSLWFLLVELRGVRNFPRTLGDGLILKLKSYLYLKYLK